MNSIRQLSISFGSTIPRILLPLALILGLLFAAPARAAVSPVEMSPGGVCEGMQCARGCCANPACCKIVEEQRASRPQPPARRAAQAQAAAIRPRFCFLFIALPAPCRPFVIRDAAGTAHALPPLTLSCIRLI